MGTVLIFQKLFRETFELLLHDIPFDILSEKEIQYIQIFFGDRLKRHDKRDRFSKVSW